MFKRVIWVALVSVMIGGVCSARGEVVPNLLDLVRDRRADLQSLRGKVATYSADGRLSLVDLYRAQCELQAEPGWVLEEVFREQITLAGGDRLALPSDCVRTVRTGPALWILTGIHGEEPAGPNSLIEQMAVLVALEKQGIPIVVMPLLNPLGYQRNWRYPDVAVYSGAHPGSSVGDSDHLLPDEKGKPRRPDPACRQAALLTGRVVALAREYPPVLSLDLHEDDLLTRGYLYSQGPAGAGDRVAAAIVGIFRTHRFPILMDGQTRFGEAVRNGMVSGARDGSIDELISATTVLVQGSPRKGPGGRSVLVLETSSMNTGLPDRKVVHATVLRSLEKLWTVALSR